MTTPRPSPWGSKMNTAATPAPSTLLDIMSEQLATSMQSASSASTISFEDERRLEPPNDIEPFEDDNIDDDVDLALAMQLQEEEDAKFEDYMQERQRHAPKGNVVLNFSNFQPPRTGGRVFKLTVAAVDPAQDEHEGEDEDDFANKKKSCPWKMRDKTLKGQGGDGEIITKHDAEANGRRNARKLEHYVEKCGSLGETLVPNATFNSFHHKMKRAGHVEKGITSRTVEDDATHGKSLDSKTLLILHRMLDAGVLDEVDSIVKSGKEATIYHAMGPASYKGASPGKPPLPTASEREEERIERLTRSREHEGQQRELAVKVYKLSSTGFNNRHEYLEGDHRFASAGQVSKLKIRKIIKIWAEKELKNLTRMHRAGIPCPRPIRLDDNVLVMSFVGKDGWSAPQLGQLDFSSTSNTRINKFYIQMLLLIRALWDRCRLVHADLSEFNTLVSDGQCFLLDVGQSVDRTHPNADEFLKRDVYNVLKFFTGLGVGCGFHDEAVTQVLSVIMGPHEVAMTTAELDADDDDEWCAYARDVLGEWADVRAAREFGMLLARTA